MAAELSVTSRAWRPGSRRLFVHQQSPRQRLAANTNSSAIQHDAATLLFELGPAIIISERIIEEVLGGVKGCRNETAWQVEDKV